MIAAADAAIFAVDVGVSDRARFAGKPLVASGVKRAIDDADAMIAEALRYADDPNAPRVEGDGGGARPAASDASTGGGDEPGAPRTRRVLMTGVSYMIPFVAAGGLLIALSFLLGGYEIVGRRSRPTSIAREQHAVQPADPAALGLDHALFDSRCSPTSARCCFIIGKTAFASSSRRSPATSPTRSPTGPASRPAS